jgi:hypothetical protein
LEWFWRSKNREVTRYWSSICPEAFDAREFLVLSQKSPLLPRLFGDPLRGLGHCGVLVGMFAALNKTVHRLWPVPLFALTDRALDLLICVG